MKTNLLTKNGIAIAMVLELGGEEVRLEEECDEDGWDWEEETVSPWGFKLSETSYKNQTDGKLVARIQELSELPEAYYEEGTDEDGDYFWRVWFPVSSATETTEV